MSASWVIGPSPRVFPSLCLFPPSNKNSNCVGLRTPYDFTLANYILDDCFRIKSHSEILLEKEMATHFSILAWRIPWMEETRRLQSTGSQKVGHD